jgi:DNA-binding NarL/FixJ family response regulator
MIKVGFIEDDSLLVRIIEEVLHFQPEIVLLFSAKSVEDFWTLLKPRATLDVLFVDISLPGQSGLEAIPQIRQRLPNTEIIMLTHLKNEDLLFHALQSGASGYLNKDFSLTQLPQFIQMAMNGEALISPHMARKLIQYFNPPKMAGETDFLSLKERQLLHLFSDGLSYDETAQVMDISTNGLRYHVRNIYKKLNVDNKVDALRVFKSIPK